MSRSTKQRFKRWVGLFLMIAVLNFGSIPVAHAATEEPPLDPAKVARARELVAQEAGALAGQNYPRAAKLLEQAYRVSPLPEIYYHLGHLLRLQERNKDAADYYRRYLDAGAGQGDAQTLGESKEFLAGFHEPTTEIWVAGESDSLLFIDGRFVGGLPLPGPLLAVAGLHRFRLEKSGHPYDSDELTIPGNQRVELRIAPGSRQTAITVLTIAPAVLLLLDFDSAPENVQNQMWQRIGAAAREERSLVLPKDKTQELLRARPDAAACADSLDCQESLAKQVDASLVLALRIKGGYQLSGRLFDALPGFVGATSESRCTSCDTRQLLRQVAELTRRILADNAGRQRGTLEVTSTPAGATVTVDKRVLGKTPYQREAFVGQHELTVEQPGLEPSQQTVNIEAGQTAQVVVHLHGGSAAPQPDTPLTRPRWRLIAGGSLLGAGVLVGGFGVAGLAVDNHCATLSDSVDTCARIYHTAGIGSGLLIGGLTLAVSGAILLALPARFGSQRKSK